MSEMKRNHQGKFVKMTSNELKEKLGNGEIKQSPIRREELPQQLQTCVRDVWNRCAQFWKIPTFEQFEIGFLRDMQPEREIGVWQRIAAAFEAYIASHPEADKADVITKLVLLTMGASGPDEMKKIFSRHGSTC